MKRVIASEDLQFHWGMVSVDVADDISNEVLGDIVTLWLSIRGFSLTGSWMERSKTMCGHVKKSGLRKDMKKNFKENLIVKF